MVTIQDIANECGVSISTVSKALNGGHDISEALRSEILDKAVAMGYTSRKAKKRQNRRLVVFVENMEFDTPDQFGYDIVLGFRQAAGKEEWAVDVINVTPEFQDEKPYDAYMLEKGYSGSFALGFSLKDPWMEQFNYTRVPTALLDNMIPMNPYVCNIGTDSEEGIGLAVEHLISLGHEKIAFLNGSVDSLVSNQRMSAYLRTIVKNHIPVDPALAIYSYFIADAAHYHVPNLLNAGATAIICGNDLLAEGVIESVRDCGLRVPEDVSVIGFDDIPTSAEFDPPITSIRQDRLALGRNGYYVLHAILNSVAQSISMLRAELVVRSSTAVAKPRLVTDRSIDKDSVMYQNPDLYNARY